jgi:hypothetical protein
LELAGSPERASQIVTGWGESGLRAARRFLVIDYSYMLSYEAFLMAWVEMTRVRLGRGGTAETVRGKRAIGWGQVPVVGCDEVEGLALLQTVAGRCAPGRTRLLRRVAVAKLRGHGLTSTVRAGAARTSRIG